MFMHLLAVRYHLIFSISFEIFGNIYKNVDIKISSKYSLFVLFIYCCQNLVFYYEDNLNVKSNSVTTRLST